MNFDKLKLEYISHNIQVIVFSKSGLLLDTCNSVVKLSKETNLFEKIVFLEGLKEQIQNLTDDDHLDFNCVSNPFGNDGAFDFTFELNEDQNVVWFICDYTPQYNRLKVLQQSRNESAIRKEKLTALNKKLKVEKELMVNQSGKSENDSKSSIFIKIDSLLVNFNLEDICLAEAYGDYVKIMDKEKRYHVVYSTLKKVQDKLPASEYVRVHRSFLVRLDAIENVDGSNMIINDKIVPISKKYRTEFIDKLNTL